MGEIKKCIYCLSSENNFNGREHIIPQMFGTFINNPVLPKGVICDSCNHSFSSLENAFKRETMEGYFCQMLNLNDNDSIRFSSEHLSVSNDRGFENPTFKNLFPFLNGEGNITFDVAHIVVNGTNKTYIYPYEKLLAILEQSNTSKDKAAKLERYKRILLSVEKKDISIFACSEKTYDGIIELLKNIGIDFKPNPASTSYESLGQLKKKRIVGQHTKIKYSPNTLRIIAKVAFNYFIFCCISEEKQEILYLENFDRIRNIGNGSIQLKMGEDVKISNTPILHEIVTKGGKLMAHQIVFYRQDNNIYSDMSLFGQIIYTVSLGKLSNEFVDQGSFGCGHIFNPFSGEIYNLTTAPSNTLSPTSSGPIYGLFRN